MVGLPGADVVHISGRPLMSNDGINFVASACTACVGAGIAYVATANYAYKNYS